MHIVSLGDILFGFAKFLNVITKFFVTISVILFVGLND